MSDKSFGDCPSRNIVKNPLLSTAVTGLSIEDLTHNAVLVPVAANQGLITRSDHQIGTNVQTLAYSDHDFNNFPSGDSNTNVFPPQTTISTLPPTLDHPQNTHHDKKPETTSTTVSKATAKSEDDFDVNEYFARLQGTRYVSAPINSNADQNANLETEENLEEINLNDDKNIEVQQSLTADIAQNFSQLPTVLPHVASAVFSSFSNMLNYKSREQTPDEKPHSYQDVQQFQSQGPLVPSFPPAQTLVRNTPAVAEDVVKEVAPPPKEPPVCGTSNFRISTKKKYAQIPGLSSGHHVDTTRKIALNPLTQNVPSYFIPAVEASQNVTEPIGTVAHDSSIITEPKIASTQETYNILNPIDDSSVRASDFQPNAFSIPKESEPTFLEERLPPPPTSYPGYDTPKDAIPPPPMFSTQRQDCQTGISVLPPSVARRIGSNHPVIKPSTMQPMIPSKIFVPTFESNPDPIGTQPAQSHLPLLNEPHSYSAFGAKALVTSQAASQEFSHGPLPSTNVPTIPQSAHFIPHPPPGFGSQSSALTSQIAPPSNISTGSTTPKMAAPLTGASSTNVSVPPICPPNFASKTSDLFVPSAVPTDTKSSTWSDASLPLSSNIFSPTSQITDQTVLPPVPTQLPPIGFSSSLFTPKSTTNVAPAFYNPETANEQSKIDQPFANEPSKPLIEPPKSTGTVNYRMNKKKPQYYSGPIEGVGSISNSVKPVIPSIDSSTFQGALFTPMQPQTEQNVATSMPFDISKQAESVPLIPQYNVGNPTLNAPSAAFDITQPTNTYTQFEVTNPTQNYDQYNTLFDFSRPTTDSFEEKEEPRESKGFGIIGSLKSKLSSIDINKIQHSVTTFFDPTYNETKKDDSISQDNPPYTAMPYQTQTAQSSLEIFVPNIKQSNQQYNYNYQQQQPAVYPSNQYQSYPNYQMQSQPYADHSLNYFQHPSDSLHVNRHSNEQESYAGTTTNASIFPPTKPNPATNVYTEVDNKNTGFNDPVSPEVINPKEENQENSSEKKLCENVSTFAPDFTQIGQDVITIKQKSANSFFEMESLNLQSNIKSVEGIKPDDLPLTQESVVPQVAKESLFKIDPFEQRNVDTQNLNFEQISVFEPKLADIHANLTMDNKEAAIKPIGNMFASKTFGEKDEKEKQNISKYGTQKVDLFANPATDTKNVTGDNTTRLFRSLPVEHKEYTQKFSSDTKANTVFSGTLFDSKELIIPKDSLLNSLTKDDVPILGVSSVPLFGLSTIIADKSKEYSIGEDISNLTSYESPKNLEILDPSMSFFDHPIKREAYGSPNYDDVSDNTASFSFFENVGTIIQKDEQHDQNKDTGIILEKNSASFFENIGAKDEEILHEAPVNDDIVLDKDHSVEFSEKNTSVTPSEIENASELSICETCREVGKPEDKEFDDQDVTTQLIENLTSRIQLSNPVEAPLGDESLRKDATAEQVAFDAGQFDEISHITEETIETIQVQSATELLEDVDEIKAMNYGWASNEILKPDYSFNIDPNSIGFFGKSSIFFNKSPTNVDETKHHEELLARRMSIPSAPPAEEEEEEEEDSKSDEAGVLDVHSIEQDANKDFPLFEEFVIEPSEAGDDKTEDKEKPKSEVQDTFTNRVEKFKQMDLSDIFSDIPSQPISMASYFDTGNYAAETHYRNQPLPSPSTISIPPGFEEEFKKRLALAKIREEKLKEHMKTVPETSTQTRPTLVLTYSTAQSMPTYTSSPSIVPVGFNVEENITSLVDDQSDNLSEFSETCAKPDTKPEKTESKLPDPINFFSDNANATENQPESFSRLASYFSSPPKTEHAKSFFELSESQNHYRHASSNETNRYVELMKDLTSVQNITVPKDQTIRHVNYFTVEYDSILPEFSKGDVNKDKAELADDTDKIDLDSLVTNCRYCAKIIDTTFKVRTAMNDNSEGGNTNPNMEVHKEGGRGSVTVNFGGFVVHEEPNEGVASMNENRSPTEYTPVKHHWFHRVDIEDKSIWRGFSLTDSRALETAYLSPDLDDNTLVATDGGRYDVNIVGRLRIPVYWNDKPTNVRRCSWFYKGTTDARYVPYTEAVAEKLEEEYRHGMTTGEWHRRLVLPDGEVVVMHGPSVMVHFLHSDNFSTSPLFSFGKRVYRNPPKIRVSRDQPAKIDHLILLVHGAGEYKCQKEKIQSCSRPRVVRRGHDETEIEDPEPSSIDHLLLLCHGVGSACDMRFRSVEEVVEDFRATSLQLIQSHYRNSYDQGIVSRVEVLPISWHATLHSGETGVDRRLSQITLDSIPRLRNFTNDTVLDVLFYTSPVFCQTITDTVCKELNRIYKLFVQRNPNFKGGVSLGGHSLGSVILYDLLCHQSGIRDGSELNTKHYVTGPAGTGQPSVRYPSLVFAPDALYALGSPIAIFECIRGVESLGVTFSLPTCKNFFNIFHPYDPIAYRIEPLINPRLRDLKPLLIPHHKGRKRMHLELKDTMARVGADLKQKLLESLKSTWNKWKAQPPTDGQLEKVVEEEMEKEQLCDESKEELAMENELATPDMLGRLNGGRRVDYVLQEAPLEMINEYLFAMSSHVGYWESEDTMLLMLREIYSALGVQPDSTVPQQNMTVQRTRRQDETIVLNASEVPSTSHGAK